MKILLDTNIIIHREAYTVINKDIGVLFKWLDNLHHTKCVHPVTIEEINRYKDPKTLQLLNIKLDNYNTLQTEAPLSPLAEKISKEMDRDDNDINDTKLLNELLNNRIDILITEDRKIVSKANLLGIADKVFTIESFLEKVTAENPALVDYKVLSVKQELFGNIDLKDDFFSSFKEDYAGFDKWFNNKAEQIAYVCRKDNEIAAFLYLKVEGESENYADIEPQFIRKKRLKIGTFKVTLNGYKIGERFIKIIFDNAIRFKVDEIYATIFESSPERQRLISLFEDYGFSKYGVKTSSAGKELVYTRNFNKNVNLDDPKTTYPYISGKSRVFLVPIYPQYHTTLFPDSILRTESPIDFVENEPFRNAISKVYICRSIERGLHSGDLVIFYRTGGYYESVITTIGIVENVTTNIADESQFIGLCKKRSIFADKELSEHWNYRKNDRPFVLNFLYAYSFPHRINMERLIEIGVIVDVQSAPRGFTLISRKNFDDIVRETKTDASIIVD
ncbi:MAG: PIN domain-containing protein [Planctomycetota bacterium]